MNTHVSEILRRSRQSASNPSAILRYGIAAAGVIVATGVRIGLKRIFVEAPYLPFELAVVVAAWFGGRGPGLAATGFSILVASYSFHPAMYVLVRLLIAGTLISLLVGKLRESLLWKTRAEEVLRRQKQLIEFSRDAVITTDSHRRIVTWNKGAEQMYGWTEREAVGKVIHQLLRTAGPISGHGIDEILGRERQWDGELSHTTRDGHRLDVESRQVLVSNAEDVPAGILEINRDITHRKRAEEALRDSEERLRLAQQVARVGTFEWNIQTDVDRWTPELEAMYGLPPGGFAGTERAWLELVHPEDRAEAARRDREAMDSGRFDAEWRVILPDGTIRWLFGRGWVFKDETGKPLRMIGVDIDITDRKRVEEALRESEAQFRTLAEAIPQLCWMANADGWIFWYNQRCYEYTGIAPGQAEGWGWQSVHDPEVLPKVLERWKASIASGEPFEMVFPLRRADGVFRPFLTRVVPVRDQKGNVTRWFGTHTDISEQQKTEQALRESERELQRLADSMPQLVWAADETGAITYVNRQWSERIGLPMERSLGDAWVQVLHPDDVNKTLLYWHRCLETGEQYQIEYRLRALSGEYRWFLARAVPIRDEQGRITHWFGTATDIEETKRAEERLRHTQKLESVGVLAGGIAHDFNNLLTAILGNASMILEEVDAGQARRVEGIIGSAERAANLTRQLLAYSGRGEFVVRDLDVSRAVHEVSDLMQFSIPKSAELLLNVQKRLPMVRMDPSQLQQILMNLVTNAGEAIGEGNPGKITVATFLTDVEKPFVDAIGGDIAPGRYVCIEVCDNGGGIKADIRPKLFDPFFTTRFTGRGLGLAAVAGIVRSQKGAITLESVPGHGSTFRVLLPVTEERVQEQAQRVGADARATILVVDDEPGVRDFIANVLHREGYHVLTACHGKDALTVLAREKNIDAVVLDLVMPVMGADELLHKTEARQPKLKVLLTSGYSESEARRLFAAYPSAAFIQKPYTARQILSAVEDLLGVRKSSS